MLIRNFKTSKERVPPANKGKVYPERGIGDIGGVSGKDNHLYEHVTARGKILPRQEGWNDGGLGSKS